MPPTSTDSPRRPAALRLFVALWPREETRASIAAVQHGLTLPPGVRPVAPPALHVTLAFFGTVAADTLDTVRAAARVPSVTIAMTLDRLDVWEGGIAVLQPSTVPSPLAALHARLLASLRAAGVAFDETHAFNPHVTLARKAQGAVAAMPARVAWHSAGHVLVSSAASRYSVLDRFD